jgi:hypothetical protein
MRKYRCDTFNNDYARHPDADNLTGIAEKPRSEVP